MSKKIVIAVAVSALVCGMFATNASAKHRHHAKRMAPKAQAMKAMPGNNAMNIASNSETKRAGHPVPQAMPGNNPMGIAKAK